MSGEQARPLEGKDTRTVRGWRSVNGENGGAGVAAHYQRTLVGPALAPGDWRTSHAVVEIPDAQRSRRTYWARDHAPYDADVLDDAPPWVRRFVEAHVPEQRRGER